MHTQTTLVPAVGTRAMLNQSSPEVVEGQHFHRHSQKKRAGEVTLWQSACLAGERSWVRALTTKQTKLKASSKTLLKLEALTNSLFDSLGKIKNIYVCTIYVYIYIYICTIYNAQYCTIYNAQYQSVT